MSEIIYWDGQECKVIKKRNFKAGYVIKYFTVPACYGGKAFDTSYAFTPNGNRIGRSKDAYYLCKKRGLTKLQPSSKSSRQCSIGKKDKKWYGWSHRAICGFGIGDMLFKERCPGATDETPFVKHGTVVIKTMKQAKEAARRFARYVS